MSTCEAFKIYELNAADSRFLHLLFFQFQFFFRLFLLKPLIGSHRTYITMYRWNGIPFNLQNEKKRTGVKIIEST